MSARNVLMSPWMGTPGKFFASTRRQNGSISTNWVVSIRPVHLAASANPPMPEKVSRWVHMRPLYHNGPSRELPLPHLHRESLTLQIGDAAGDWLRRVTPPLKEIGGHPHCGEDQGRHRYRDEEDKDRREYRRHSRSIPATELSGSGNLVISSSSLRCRARSLESCVC